MLVVFYLYIKYLVIAILSKQELPMFMNVYEDDMIKCIAFNLNIINYKTFIDS